MPGHAGGRAGRVAAWRAAYWARQEAATTEADRLAAAVDLLRLVISKCIGPERRAALVEAVVADLVATAERVMSSYVKNGRKV